MIVEMPLFLWFAVVLGYTSYRRRSGKKGQRMQEKPRGPRTVVIPEATITIQELAEKMESKGQLHALVVVVVVVIALYARKSRDGADWHLLSGVAGVVFLHLCSR